MKNRLIKVVSWRAMSVGITVLVTYGYTGDVVSASKMTAILHVFLMTGHYLFETLWEKYEKG